MRAKYKDEEWDVVYNNGEIATLVRNGSMVCVESKNIKIISKIEAKKINVGYEQTAPCQKQKK